MKTFTTHFNEKKGTNCAPLLVLLFVLYLSLPSTAVAWVHSEDLVALDQTALDTLATGLTSVTGSLTIGDKEANNINDLSKLDSLKTVGWDLKIQYTKLTNLSDLSRLESITGSFTVTGNDSLATIGSMSALKTIGDTFQFFSNPVLKNIDTFAKLESIANFLFIYKHPMLENLDGFKSLISCGDIDMYSNPKLLNLDGLAQIDKTISTVSVYDNEMLSEFCGLYRTLKKSPDVNLHIAGNAENPNREQILYGCGPHTIHTTVWYDKNENATVDADEKGLPDVIIRLALTEGVVKHLTNNSGHAVFEGLPEGVKNICIDMNSLPANVTCTTGNVCTSQLVNEDCKIAHMYFGFSGDELEALAQDYVIEQIDEYIQPDKLFFVSGSPVYTPAKYDYGWDNLVDESVDPDTGSTWAAVNAQAEKPWAIFEFGDKGLYKFNYVKFQTGNGQVSKLAYLAQQIEVLCSTTGTDDADFVSAGVFKCTYSANKMQWVKLPDYVTAKYIKVCLLSPTVPGKYVQIVEFDVDTEAKNGPIPATQSEEIANISQAQALLSNYPNPFNPATKIVYQLYEDAHVSLKIYNLTGKQVAELVNNEQAAGQYEMTWNAGHMPSGVYFMSMKAGKEKSIKRILLMK